MGGENTEVLLQAMSPQGREIILGGKKDPVFGHAILFGLGGVFVELLEKA
jgi:acyl-CoA synthetase (NDP forming)